MRHFIRNGTDQSQNESNQPDQLGLLSTIHGQCSQQQSREIPLRSVFSDKKKKVSQGSHAEIRKIVQGMIEVHDGGGSLDELVKPAREPASGRLKPRVSLKNAPKILPVHHSLLALVGRKQIVVRDQLSP